MKTTIMTIINSVATVVSSYLVIRIALLMRALKEDVAAPHCYCITCFNEVNQFIFVVLRYGTNGVVCVAYRLNMDIFEVDKT